MNLTPGTVERPAPPTTLDLQAENTRLQRLVADLLVKNQQLRVALRAAQLLND